jgi:Ca2+-binding RTX toxin-like protein
LEFDQFGQYNGLLPNPVFHGFQQNKPGLTPSIFLSPLGASDKPALNTLIHEIGHFKWQGLGTEPGAHTPLFHRYLSDALVSFGITPNAKDTNGITPFAGVTPAGAAGIPAYLYNSPTIPSGNANPDIGVPSGYTWTVLQTPLTGEILQTASIPLTGLKALQVSTISNAFGQILSNEVKTFSPTGISTLNLTIFVAGIATSQSITTKDATGAITDQLIDSDGDGTFETHNGLLGDDTLTGSAIDDKLDGGVGNDTLLGLDGNDTLTGGAGADNLQGGLGNDTYNIDATDTLTEAASAGTDTVNAGFTYTLLANFENLTLTGAGVINGNGNALANVINGNAAANIISGLAGNDTLNGDAGNDSIDGGTGNDTIDGGVGTDTLLFSGARANYTFLTLDATHTRITDARVGGDGVDVVTGIESVHFTDGTFLLSALVPPPVATIINGTAGNDTLTGTAGNDTISGLAGDDTINGGAGNDRIIGGAGLDTMTGGLGADTFVFADNDFAFGSILGTPVANPDIIADFANLLDKIDLSAIDANTGVAGNQAFTIFTPSGFDINAPAGSIKIVNTNNGGIGGSWTDIFINTDSDAAWEGQIRLNGGVAVASDFIL